MAEKNSGDGGDSPTLDIAGAFGEGEEREWAGRKWTIRHLDLNDLIVVQRRIGSLDKINLGDMEHIRLLFWLFLRKSDPGVTAADVDAEHYIITEAQVGRMLTLRRMNEPATGDFIRLMMIGAGLQQTDEERVKNEEAATANP